MTRRSKPRGSRKFGYPTNTSDPIAIINGEVISRQRLADECVIPEGAKILETLIARLLIEQAMRRKKIEVTAAEIDQEIDQVADEDRSGYTGRLAQEPR